MQPLRSTGAYRVALLSALLYSCQSFELRLGFILLGLQLIHVALRCIRISACCLQLSQPFLRPHLPLHKLVLSSVRHRQVFTAALELNFSGIEQCPCLSQLLLFAGRTVSSKV